MKKILKTILSINIMLLMVCVNKVKAIECEDLKMYASSSWYDKDKAYMQYHFNGDDWNMNYEIYQLTDNSDTTATRYSIYCRNPGISSGGSVGETFYCKKTVFDSTTFDSDDTSKIYDAGIIAILRNGYSSKNPNFNSVKNVEEYVATNLALRVFEMLSPSDTNGDRLTDNRGLLPTHRYYANLWREDSKIKELLNYVYGDLVPRKFDDVVEVNGFIDAAGNKITAAVEEMAKELLIKGFEAAKYYKDHGAATLKGVDDKPLKEKEVVTTDSDGKKEYKTILTYTFEADKFKVGDPYIKINFNCENCSKYGVKVEYELKVNDEVKNYSPNVNIVNYLDDGAGKIEFKIIFTASSDKYKCEQLDYKMDLEWYDDTISVEAFDMYSSGCTASTGCQHFYMLYAEDVPTNKTIEDKIELCSISCKELEEACKAGNSKACTQWEEKYNSDCAQCTTHINNIACSEEDSNIDIVEGYDVDTSNCGTITEENNSNVLQCIIDGFDSAGNSYDSSETTELVTGAHKDENQFCKVYCKEDYHFVLPGIKEVNSGRYFSLSASVKGKKSCYTSEIDEGDTFEDLLDIYRKRIVTYWNDWNKWYQGLNGDYKDTENLHTASNLRCNNWGFAQCSTSPSGLCELCIDRCNCSVQYNGFKRTWVYTTYSEDGVSSQMQYTETHDGGEAKCECHSGSGKDGTIQNIESYIREQLEGATQRLYDAINEYIDLINQYNGCSGVETVKYDEYLKYSDINGWKMEYKYDPKISFWYQESYMNDVLTDKLDTMDSVSIGSIKQQICESDTDKSYNECDEWKDKIDKSVTTSQFVCKKNGDVYTCGTEELIISKAKYVKQEMESSGEYITPTQFYSIYPTGAIVVAEAGKEDEIENSSELTNMLPVGLGTTQGVYTYTLQVTDLGEYYNSKDKLGRIWGSEDSTVVTVLEDEDNVCIQEGALQSSVKVDDKVIDNGVYVCSYKVNCPDCPVECDESGCKNPNCPSGNCPVECNNCTYTNGSTNISYKPISPGNVNPSDRELGVNWKYDENSIRTALELKAYATTTEIEEKGETIYDIDYEDITTDVDRDFAVHIKLDSKLISKIRTYNDRYENNGGYANNTLKCYEYTQNGITYENIYCYSTFIDELLYDSSTKNNIQIVGNRIIGTNAESSDTQRKALTQTSGYWTTWAESNSTKWTITTEKGIDYYKQNYSEIGIGPSWK